MNERLDSDMTPPLTARDIVDRSGLLIISYVHPHPIHVGQYGAG